MTETGAQNEREISGEAGERLMTLADAIAVAKEQIARLAGADPNNIRIIIEM